MEILMSQNLFKSLLLMLESLLVIQLYCLSLICSLTVFFLTMIESNHIDTLIKDIEVCNTDGKLLCRIGTNVFEKQVIQILEREFVKAARTVLIFKCRIAILKAGVAIIAALIIGYLMVKIFIVSN